ncbi:MAG: MmcQ/YjbR family DNA-binding protein [Candidatus Dormibacteraeota bacterium]|nr:MmcQ/YjbR family DNA-binding protein [Candidatus Dormibacteraeota bacterium]
MVDDHRGLRDPRARLLEICLGLPEVTVSGDRHVAFQVGKRRFAYYLDDHHGDGRLALNCKVPHGDMEALVALDPSRFFVPAYLGAKGWIGVRLDQEDVDWDEVARFVAVSYRLVAPRRLAVRVL